MLPARDVYEEICLCMPQDLILVVVRIILGKSFDCRLGQYSRNMRHASRSVGPSKQEIFEFSYLSSKIQRSLRLFFSTRLLGINMLREECMMSLIGVEAKAADF